MVWSSGRFKVFRGFQQWGLGLRCLEFDFGARAPVHGLHWDYNIDKVTRFRIRNVRSVLTIHTAAPQLSFSVSLKNTGTIIGLKA